MKLCAAKDFELQVSQPQVIYHEKDGVKMEPYEVVTIDVPNEYQGSVIEEMGKRGGRNAAHGFFGLKL